MFILFKSFHTYFLTGTSRPNLLCTGDRLEVESPPMLSSSEDSTSSGWYDQEHELVDVGGMDMMDKIPWSSMNFMGGSQETSLSDLWIDSHSL